MTLTRRQVLASSVFGAAQFGGCEWFRSLATAAPSAKKKSRHCILLWMSGGPSQIDTFDLKPRHENGGEFEEIATAVPGVKISENLPGLARHTEHLAILRGLSTKEGDHGRGTYLMRTGQKPMSEIQYPALGSSLGRQLEMKLDMENGLPSYVSIGPYLTTNIDAFGPGFLGPRSGPLVVGNVNQNSPGTGDGYAELKVQSLEPISGLSTGQIQDRIEIWKRLQSRFIERYADGPARAHHSVYGSALDLMGNTGSKAFDLSQEDDSLREKYGRGQFGQGCLLARRLIEHGVSFIEVSLGRSSTGAGWDSHSNNFQAVRDLSQELDAGWSTLIEDLDQRGLLETTTIVWMGEFGRTPRINSNAGRDHFPSAWSCVLSGGGINGGQVYGETSPDGMNVIDGKVGVSDVLATICSAVGIAPETSQMSNTGRPVPISDGSPVSSLLKLGSSS